jgi:hypothetical protein
MLKHSSIPTVTTLQRQNSLIDRRRRAADRVIAVMRGENLSLHCSYEPAGAHWWLSDGRPVQRGIAELVTRHRHRQCRRRTVQKYAEPNLPLPFVKPWR